MNEPQSSIYEFGEFRLDAAKRLLLKGENEIVPLMPKAFDTLLYLVENSGKIIGKDELMREIWSDTIVEENNLNQNISILRKVFGEKRGEHRFIATVPGRGYKFVAEVRRVGRQEGKAAVPEIRSMSPTSESGGDENRNPSRRTRKPGYKILVATGSILLIAIIYGFYFRRPAAPETTARSIAVLPFKPLVAENRDEALEMGMADTLIARRDGNKVKPTPPAKFLQDFLTFLSFFRYPSHVYLPA